MISNSGTVSHHQTQRAEKIVFTDNAFDEDAVEYASEMVSYDPINGDWTGYVKIPSLATGADTTIQMYYDYTPSATPSYVPELLPDNFTGSAILGEGSATVIDDFSTWTTQGNADTEWTSENTAKTRVNITTNLIDIDQAYSTGEHAYIAKDFGAGVVDTKNWQLRFKINYSTWGTSSIHCFSMSDGDETVSSNTNQSNITGSLNGQGTKTMQLQATDSGVVWLGGSTIPFTTVTGTDYYVEIMRIDGSKVIMNLYSDSAYSILLRTVSNDASTVTGDLRYFKISNIDWDVTIPAGDINATFDDFEFSNGTSVDLNREQATWNGNYKAVHHLQGNSTDSTVYGNDGTNTAVAWEQQNNSVGCRKWNYYK
jgi:hypothetical protein